MNQRKHAGLRLPYLPEGRDVFFVPESNAFMQEAKAVALEHSTDHQHPTGASIVVGDRVMAVGSNGSNYHVKNGCERKRLSIPTGQQYELCPGCDPYHHAEQEALRNAREAGVDVRGADMYVWGHWWCCQWCWEAMIKAGIKDVYLLENAYELFGQEREMMEK